MQCTEQQRYRILVVDDNEAIHNDFRKILCGAEIDSSPLAELEMGLFGDTKEDLDKTRFEIESAYQGKDGFELTKRALAEGKPFAMAFVDMRMPPGWDGIETVSHIRGVDREIQVVICTAYSDYTWDEIVQKLDCSESLLILKKPFDNIEIVQLAHALTKKWLLQRELRGRLSNLESLVKERTKELQATNEKLKAEITERERMQAELQLDQRLKAVGQLAAGIAHEINTPTQFVSDSIFFLDDAFQDLLGMVDQVRTLCTRHAGDDEQLQRDIQAAEEEADLGYLRENVPRAFERVSEGLDRVKNIVQAMKEFGHPEDREMTPADLNKMIQTTLTVARNEYKYVAEIETDLGEVPLVHCRIGQINQVFIILITNAAHAIADVVGDSGEKRAIHIRTRSDGNAVVVDIEDEGCGISEEIRDRIYEQFFTTKEVGRGTGQGLCIARSIIVDGHGGSLTCESEVGKGTTFTIRLPQRSIDADEAGE